MIATRYGFADELLQLGNEFDNICVIDCDVSSSAKSDKFAKTFPDRSFNVGIAEQNAAAIAGGLASQGKIPFVVSYAIFTSLRMTEMIRQLTAYPKFHVIFVGSHGGLSPAADGASHQAIEDLGVLRSIPNIAICMPADYPSARKLVRDAVVNFNCPVYLRFTRNDMPIIYPENPDVHIGQASLIADGNDVSIYAIGDTLRLAIESKKALNIEGINAEVVDCHSVKPIDKQRIIESIKKTGKIITVEDHNIIGGLGSAVAEVIAEYGKGILRRIGINDHFGESAPYERLLIKNGITTENIIRTAKALIGG